MFRLLWSIVIGIVCKNKLPFSMLICFCNWRLLSTQNSSWKIFDFRLLFFNEVVNGEILYWNLATTLWQNIFRLFCHFVTSVIVTFSHNYRRNNVPLDCILLKVLLVFLIMAFFNFKIRVLWLVFESCVILIFDCNRFCLLGNR